jgi:hypothetical protein
MIIFKSILAFFKLSIVLRASWGSNVNWLEPKIDPPSANLAYPNPWNAMYMNVLFTDFLYLLFMSVFFWQMTSGENGIDFKLATIKPVSTTTALGASGPQNSWVVVQR